MSESGGLLSLLPTLLVFVLAVWSRRPIESLICGALLGLVMLEGSGFVAGMAVTIPTEWTGVWETDGYTKIWVIYSWDGSALE